VRERKRDYYYRKAKEEKYRSRAAYKLLQAAQKYGFLKRGDVVLDLGSTPGGWLQVARRIVGKPGFVLGVDLKKTVPLDATSVHTLVGDITDTETQALIEEILPAKPDVIVSDVSPNVSGVWEVDHARQIDLARESFKLALKLLKKDGNFFVKVFQGDMSQEFIEEAKEHFARVEIVKPKASRSKSAEVYVLGMGLKRVRVDEMPVKG
jgi:23S rRNA (uridine2552-2'-O)-methyltransferase